MRLFVILFLSNFLFAQESRDLLYKQAVDFYQSEQYDSSLSIFNKILLLYPNDTLVYLDRALNNEIIGDELGAVEDYSKLIILDSNVIDAIYLRGVAYYRIAQYSHALQDLEFFVSKENQNAYAYYYIGKIYLLNENNKLATKYFKNSIKLNNCHSESLFELAKLKYNRHHFHKALSLVKKSVESFPNLKSLNLKCKLLLKMNKIDEAAECLKSIYKLKEESYPSFLSDNLKIKKIDLKRLIIEAIKLDN